MSKRRRNSYGSSISDYKKFEEDVVELLEEDASISKFVEETDVEGKDDLYYSLNNLIVVLETGDYDLFMDVEGKKNSKVQDIKKVVVGGNYDVNEIRDKLDKIKELKEI